MAEEVGSSESVPRTVGRQRHRTNVESSSPCEYYKRAVTIPLLDSLIHQMHDRFSEDNRTAVDIFCLTLVSCLNNDTDDFVAKVLRGADFYKNDLPSFDSLKLEAKRWRRFWEDKRV